MILGIVLYFLLVTAAMAVWLLPSVRAGVLDRTQRAWSRGRTRCRAWASCGERHAQAAWGRWTQHRRAAVNGVQAHARWLTAAGLLLVVAPALALALRSWWRLDGFDHTATRAVDERIAALLQGEQLVPPPPLPPELFDTREVELVHPLARTASRQWELLDPEFRRRLLGVFKQLQQHGYEAVLLEGYRSPERQAELARLGPAVTQAGAYESYHQFGLAADVAFLRDGRIVLSEKDPWAMRGYERYGEVAASLGLEWGGAWRSLKDFGHVELRRAAAPARHAAASDGGQALLTPAPRSRTIQRTSSQGAQPCQDPSSCSATATATAVA